MDNKTIGALVKAKRIAMGISYRELSKRTGKSTRSIMDVEDAVNNYTFGTLTLICRALEMEVLVREVPPAPPSKK
jgi:transcriptional regulator with XRE-family HTH domain